MNSKIKQILLHSAMLVAIGLVVLGTVLQFGYRAGLIAAGVGMGVYVYLLGAD